MIQTVVPNSVLMEIIPPSEVLTFTLLYLWHNEFCINLFKRTKHGGCVKTTQTNEGGRRLFLEIANTGL